MKINPWRFGKLTRPLLSFVLALALLLPLNLSISAGGPDLALGIAPLNPAFLQFVEETSQRGYSTQGADISVPEHFSYGYMPHPARLGHSDTSILAEAEAATAGLNAAASLPSTWDWRTQNKVTPVKDQGTAGTCWAFGIEAMLESRLLIVENTQYNLSELNLAAGIDPSWVYYNSDRANIGGDSYMATDTLAKMGTRDESAQPYGNPDDAYATVNNAVCNVSAPLLQRVTDFRLVTNNGTTSSGILKIKNAIYTYGPVSAAFYVANSGLTSTYDYATDFNNPNYEPNHMVLLVGWNDSISHPSDGGKGAWIAKNSWSSDWGLDGYFYLCYGGANLEEAGSYHGSDGYESYNSSEKVYYWDEAGWIAWFGSSSTTTRSAWMRSVFTAENANSLKAVAFWTAENNAQYQIYIRDENDTLLSTQSGTCDEAGYYTIELSNPAGLTLGRQFKIDVKITNPTYTYPIPVEIVYTKNNITYYTPPIQSGATFFKARDTDDWVDTATISEVYGGFNICLRAITGIAGPAVTSQAASYVGAYTATLNATLNSLGDSTEASVYFRYGTSTAYGSNTDELILTSTGSFSIGIPLSSPLIPDTTYHFQAAAQGDYEGVSLVYGSDLTFKTGKIVYPALTTGKASDLTYSGAILNGKLTKLGAATGVTAYFQYGSDKNYGSLSVASNLDAIGNFSQPVTGLTSGATYHFRAVVLGNYPNAAPIYGKDATFKTKAYAKPTITTSKASGITKTEATLNANLSKLGDSKDVAVYFEYGATKYYGSKTETSTWNVTGNISSTLEDLAPGATCYYRAVARGDYKDAPLVYGAQKSFKTVAIAAPSVSSLSAKVISGQVALKAKLSKMGSSTGPVEVHFEYWTAADPTNKVSTEVQSMTTTGSFECTLYVPGDLAAGTVYNCWAVAEGDGATTSSIKKFTPK